LLFILYSFFLYSKSANLKKPRAKAPVLTNKKKKNDNDIGRVQRDHKVNVGDTDDNVSDCSEADNKSTVEEQANDKKGKQKRLISTLLRLVLVLAIQSIVSFCLTIALFTSKISIINPSKLHHIYIRHITIYIYIENKVA
jgi:hypothetical protein